MKELTSRQKQSLKTQIKIVKTALRLMKEKGYENTGIREICSESNISIGAFYHHFNSKEDMINIGFSMYDKYLAEVLDKCSETDPLKMLYFVLLNQTEYLVTECGNLITGLYRALFSSNDKYPIKKDRLYYRTVWKYTDQCICQKKITTSISCDYLSELLIRMVRGDIIDWCLHDCSYDLIEYVKKDLDVMFNGLSNN